MGMHRQEDVKHDKNTKGSGLVKMVLLLMLMAAAIYLVGTIKDVWATGQWEELLSWNAALSLAFFVFHTPVSAKGQGVERHLIFLEQVKENFAAPSNSLL